MEPAPRLSYGFAKEHGVLLVPAEDGRTVCRHRADAPIEALIEAQRLAAALAQFEPVGGAEFEADLNRLYRDSASEAARVASEADGDLAALADTAASVDDLLDQRVINVPGGVDPARHLGPVDLAAASPGLHGRHVKHRQPARGEQRESARQPGVDAKNLHAMPSIRRRASVSVRPC
ncbi:hypothetical protein LCGC14_2777620 [marine sediment metagenome]|uniref:Type II secretion system protein E N1E domain-containing protein n=1 Tax=marine sediment metagenome TaxID=412755 RepID=A0A0F8YU84_9ZZZZ